jgi:hypothetical protein
MIEGKWRSDMPPWGLEAGVCSLVIFRAYQIGSLMVLIVMFPLRLLNAVLIAVILGNKRPGKAQMLESFLAT